MTLIIVMLVIMAIFFVIMGWINKYSWLVSLMSVALAMAMYSVMMTIAIKGNYMPTRFIGYLDEMYFLSIVKNRLGIFWVVRVFNISIALYIFALVNFVPVYFNHFGKYDFKKFLKRLPCAVFPVLYVWFYDKQTAYWFYNQILFNKISYDVFQWIDLCFTCIFIGYMLWPLIYLAINQRNIKLKHKRKQVLGVLIFVVSLDLIMLIKFHMQENFIYLNRFLLL